MAKLVDLGDGQWVDPYAVTAITDSSDVGRRESLVFLGGQIPVRSEVRRADLAAAINAGRTERWS
jgi:hypothetical protein